MARIDLRDFTHYARFYGIPVYFNVRTDMLVGRNWFYDWLVLHVCPHMHTLIDTLSWLIYGEGLAGWMIELRGEIHTDPDRRGDD